MIEFEEILTNEPVTSPHHRRPCWIRMWSWMPKWYVLWCWVWKWCWWILRHWLYQIVNSQTPFDSLK